ncbi:ATP-binding protein [Oceanirhabdus sp. W0125-5]|uniref:ATP-binding protein n=1 Tax=Oceanirhabdus sp. W0125-5 TaxID=2999116 RepID=UPI0022F329C1|nr:ATP-binding protein [Oceanirhabdus sp. W0125-5]WBW97892.1 ATP-binding protein [Oceanirhabdus sp. W0125-5]
MEFKFAIIDKLYKDMDYEIYVVLIDGEKKIIKKIERNNPNYSGLYKLMLQEIEYCENNISDECLEPERIHIGDEETYLIYKHQNFFPIDKLIGKKGMEIREFLHYAIMICDKLFVLHKKDIHGALNHINILINNELNEIKFIGGIHDVNNLDYNKILLVESDLLNYISPEHTGLFESYVDYKSDLYSLGIVFYKMITGRAPFEQNSKRKLIYNQAIKKPSPPKDIKNNIPKSLSEVIMKLLSKSKRNRYETVHGVKCDLIRILQQIKQGKDVEIIIGEHDIPCRLTFSEKIYGRNKEVNQLMNIYNRVKSGEVHSVVVEGESGIGKTTFINKFIHSIKEDKSIVIILNEDSIFKDDSDVLISNVLDQLLFYCLVDGDIDIEELRSFIIKITGGCFGYLQDIIPRFKYFACKDKKKKNNSCICLKKDVVNIQLALIINLIERLINEGNTIVFNFDINNKYKKDFNNLLKQLLTNKKYKSIMIIETSLTQYDGIINRISNKCKDSTNNHSIHLKNIEKTDIEEMIKDLFKVSQDYASNIANICFMKTKGNYFLIKEYILKLYKEKVIFFDYDNYCWKMKFEKIHSITINDNIKKELEIKLNNIPKEVKFILKICSCLPNEFDSKMIQQISGYSNKTIQKILNYCIRNRIIEEKRRFDSLESYNCGVNKFKKYKFISRNIRNCILEQLNFEDKNKYIYKAGMFYMKNYDEYSCNWFIIYCFINTNMLPKISEDLMKLEELFYKNARRVFNSGDYLKTLESCEKGQAICERLGKEKIYFKAIKARCFFRLGNIREGEKEVEFLLGTIKDSGLKVKAKIIKLYGYLINDKYYEAEEVIFDILSDFDNSISKIDDKISFFKKINLLMVKLYFRKSAVLKKYDDFVKGVDADILREFIYLSALVFSYTNVYRFLYMSFISIIFHNLYKVKHNHMVNILKKYYRFMINDMSKVMEIALFEMVPNANNIKENLLDLRQLIIFGSNSFYFSIDGNIKDDKCSTILSKLVQYNDQAYIIYLIHTCIIYKIALGYEIDSIIELIEQYEFKLEFYNSQVVNEIKEIKDIVIRCIKSDEKVPQVNNNDMLTLKTIKVQAKFLKKEYSDIDFVFTMKMDEENFNSTIAILDFGFYRSLIIGEIHENLPRDKKAMAIKVFNEAMEAFDKLKKCENKIIIIKYHILKSYKYFIAKKYKKALALAFEANELASKNNYIMGIGISNEICGQIYMKKNLKNLAYLHFNEAINQYNKLGISSNIGMNNLYQVSKNRYLKLNEGLEGSTIRYNEVRDVISDVNKLSSETDYATLIKKLLSIILKSMNVERVLYFQIKNGKITKDGIGDRDRISVMQSIPLDKCFDVPKTVINFVIRTRKKIVINEAVNNQLFHFDKYILENNIKSLACYPIMIEKDLIGVIYIESNDYSKGFSKDSDGVLDIIISQAGILIKNAKEYNEISMRKNNLENLVQKKSEEIQAIEKKLVKEIQDRIVVEQKLTRSREKTEFFANLSHEFKTPLNVILSTIQLIEVISNSNNDRKVSEYIKIMKQNCYRLLRLVNNIIDISKIDEGYLKLDMKNYDIIRVVEDICMSVVSYAQNKGISLIFDTEVEELIIACDEEKIERIILNILSNAIKFTEDNGDIKINMRIEGVYVVVSIKDSGIGIHRDLQDKIFERFEQADKSLSRKQEGSGIGLTLTKQLVEMHSGIINIISEYGKGSEFIIKLPINTIENNEIDVESKGIITPNHNSVEKIKIEFSDIYF